MRGELATIVEVAEQRLLPQGGGALRADALELEQHPRRRLWRGGLALGEQPIPLSLGQLDLIEQQFEPIQLAADLDFEMCRQGTAVARRQVLEPLASITAQRLVTRYSLGEQQPFYAIDVLYPSAISTLRSRQRRRRSSSSGVGALTIIHTRGSPRLYASNARSSASPSILSVLARRRRRDVAIEAGSTTCRLLPAQARDEARSHRDPPPG